jgi:hypothetical protein
MIYTGNVILTKNPKTIEDFFSGKATLGQLEKREDSFIFSSGAGSNLISFRDVRSLTGSIDSFRIHLEFIDPKREFEIRSFEQTISSTISEDKDLFVNEKYLITYGSSPNPLDWADTQVVTLNAMKLSATEGRRITLSFDAGASIHAFTKKLGHDLLGWTATNDITVESESVQNIKKFESSAGRSSLDSHATELAIADVFVTSVRNRSGLHNVIFLPNKLQESILPEVVPYSDIEKAREEHEEFVEEGSTGEQKYRDFDTEGMSAKSWFETFRDQGDKISRATRYDAAIYNLGLVGLIHSQEKHDAEDVPEEILREEGGLNAAAKAKWPAWRQRLTTKIKIEYSRSRLFSSNYKVYSLYGDPKAKVVSFIENQQQILEAWGEVFQSAPNYGPIQPLLRDKETNLINPTIVIGDLDVVAQHLYVKEQSYTTDIELFEGAARLLGKEYKDNKKVRDSLLLQGLDSLIPLKLTFGQQDSLVTKLDLKLDPTYLTAFNSVQNSLLKSEQDRQEYLDLQNLPGKFISTIGIDPISLPIPKWLAEQSKDMLGTAKDLTTGVIVPYLAKEIKKLVRGSLETVPLFSYCGQKMILQDLTLDVTAPTVLGSLDDFDFATEIYSGKYKIEGYSHDINSTTMSSTFTIIKVDMDKVNTDVLVKTVDVGNYEAGPGDPDSVKAPILTHKDHVGGFRN